MNDSDNIPLQIAFRDIAPSAAIEARIRRSVRKLTQFHPRIVGCRVVVSAPERQHHKERLYVVRISVAVPGGTIWINRGSRLDFAHADVYVAIRDAFNAAARRLEDFVRRRGGRVKQHAVEPQGVVRALNRREGYGFIATPTGDEIYFHKTSVLHDAFNRLKAGSKVRFVLGTRPSGASPQASTVRLVGKHSLAEPA
jgi:cold shock CspA family protein